MAKPKNKSYSRYAREAAELLGLMINKRRAELGFSITELAERAGLSRGLVHRIEKGHMGTSLGAAFEVAALVGVPLFESDPAELRTHLNVAREIQSLLPKSVHPPSNIVKDDF